MKTLRFIAAALMIASASMIASTEATPSPQYNSSETREAKIVHAYYLENGTIKNIRITVQHRYLKSYWNGREWVLYSKKIENNNLKENLKEDDSETTQFLASLPKTVMIENLRVYFNPEEN